MACQFEYSIVDIMCINCVQYQRDSIPPKGPVPICYSASTVFVNNRNL